MTGQGLLSQIAVIELIGADRSEVRNIELYITGALVFVHGGLEGQIHSVPGSELPQEIPPGEVDRLERNTLTGMDTESQVLAVTYGSHMVHNDLADTEHRTGTAGAAGLHFTQGIYICLSQ